jgi:hypothetical protein
MNPSDETSSPSERIDAATSQRLAKLAHAPVDVSALMAAVEQRITPSARVIKPPARAGLILRRWLTPLRAAAAGLTLFGVALALTLYATSRPARASVQMLVNYHQQMCSDMGHCLPADSVATANAALAKSAPDAPLLPEVPTTQLSMNCCCVHQQGNAEVSCLCCCAADGQRVTLVVGNERQIRPPAAPSRKIGGLTCRVTSEGGLNLCVLEHGDRWVCVVGAQPVERLAELAGAVRW